MSGIGKAAGVIADIGSSLALGGLGGGGVSGFAKDFEKRRGDRKKKRQSQTTSNTDDPGAPSYHSGGKVRKTGLARLKKGEQVLTKGQQKRIKMKGRGKRRGGKSRSR